MDFPSFTQFDSAIALQTLALPMTLILCITSMLRERSINQQDEKRLVRLYKQHAFMFELVQFFVALMACGFVAGNTIAALEARSLVIGFASEDVTATIVRSAISRNVWLVGSAWCVLACVSMLDSWSLPGSLGDLTQPMFRLTRELVRGYIWRHDHDESQIYDDDDDDDDNNNKSLPYDVEQPRPPPTSTIVTTEEAPDTEPLALPSTKPVRSTHTKPPPSPPPTAPPTPTSEKAACFPDLHALTAKAQSHSVSQSQSPHPSTQAPPPTTTIHPPASHPRYQNQTLTSALRATPKSPKSRSRQRSVTFDLKGEKGEGVKGSKRECKAVQDGREREGEESEERTRDDGQEERLSSSVTSSSIREDGFKDGSLTKSEGELDLLRATETCRKLLESGAI